jgi:SsrA-binding protein
VGKTKRKKEDFSGDRVIATNRKARHEFHLLETFEAGLVLTGSEIKSIRNGKANLQEAYAVIESGEAWLTGCYIAPYEWAGNFGHEPRRRRKMLLHRRQIDELYFSLKAKGLTLVPIRLYLKDGRAKVEIALAQGKQQHDKRHAIRERDTQRQIERALGRRDR